MADFNVCGPRKLSTLVGITPDLAARIVNYRKQKKRVKHFEELYNVNGVTREILRKIKAECFIVQSDKSSATPDKKNFRTKVRTGTRETLCQTKQRHRNIATAVPGINVSSNLFQNSGKGNKLYSPVSIQSSPSGQVLTTVYRCLPDAPTAGEFEKSTVTCNLSTKVQPPSSYGNLSPESKPATFVRGFTGRSVASKSVNRKVILSPNKEMSIKRWLREVPATAKESNALSRSSSKKSTRSNQSLNKTSPRKSHTPKRAVSTQHTPKRTVHTKHAPKRTVKKSTPKISAAERRKRGSSRSNSRGRGRSASRHSDRRHTRKLKSRSKDIVSYSPAGDTFSSVNGPRDAHVSRNKDAVRESTGYNDHDVTDQHSPEKRSSQRRRVRETSKEPGNYLDDDADDTSDSSEDRSQSQSPYSRVVSHRLVREGSYTASGGKGREQRRSRPARRSLWTDREEWRHSRRHRSRTPRDHRHRHVHRHRDQGPGLCSYPDPVDQGTILMLSLSFGALAIAIIFFACTWYRKRRQAKPKQTTSTESQSKAHVIRSFSRFSQVDEELTFYADETDIAETTSSSADKNKPSPVSPKRNRQIKRSRAATQGTTKTPEVQKSKQKRKSAPPDDRQYLESSL